MTYYSRNLELLNTIAKRAGIGLVRDFAELSQLQSAPRGHEEFTQAAVDRTMSVLRTELGKFHADFPIVTRADELPVTECFAVSPLDGMVNFMRSIPYFAISIAVVKRDQVLSAVIYNPATGDTFFAEKGSGAFKEGARNNLRLRVSSRSELSKALIAASDYKLLEHVSDVRKFGAVSLDLAMVAGGQLDGVVSNNNTLAEIAAGTLLVREAGGWNLSPQQSDGRRDDIKAIWQSGNLIAGNPTICKKLFDLV